jgi:glycosyltransferase involved in cell wall biosynthesis
MSTLLQSRERDFVESKQPFSIVYGVLTLDVGGLERMVLDLALRAAGRGHRVNIICIEHEGLLATQAKDAGIQVIALHKPPGQSQKTLRECAQLLAELRPDVLHTHHIGVLWYLGTAARKLGITNIVHTEHCDQVAQEKSLLRKLRARWWWRKAGPLARRFCGVSDDIAQSVRRWNTLPREPVRVVRNGIDTSQYGHRSKRAAIRRAFHIPDNAGVIGTLGRLVEVKRQDLLISALAELRKTMSEARLLMVGDGPERGQLERTAERHGVAEFVHFAGYQAQPADYLDAMDVFALTSRHEGLPLALLEAWASGLPVVSSAVGGIVKVVEHERTGLLFPSGVVTALTTSLRSLLDDPERAAHLADAGQAIVRDRYSLDHMEQTYWDYYREGLPSTRASVVAGGLS